MGLTKKTSRIINKVHIVLYYKRKMNLTTEESENSPSTCLFTQW